MIYTAPCVMLMTRPAYITRVSGRGLDSGNLKFFVSGEMASSRYRPLDGTIRKSTALYEVHNIRLRYRYIKTIVLVTKVKYLQCSEKKIRN
jgi:hypothetical protein